VNGREASLYHLHPNLYLVYLALTSEWHVWDTIAVLKTTSNASAVIVV
jgi:hypothetical protein